MLFWGEIRQAEVGSVKRRDVLKGLAGAAIFGPGAARAQSSAKVFKLATLSAGAPMDEKSPLAGMLLKTLDQRGYAIGKNMTFEARAAFSQVDKLGELVRGLKADQVNAIVVTGFPTALACKVANVPTVVALGAGDPVATHLIESLSRPGGNLTGISDDAVALSTKRLTLIKQAVPKLRRIAMLWNKDDLGMSMRFEASADAARSISTTVQALGVRQPDDFNGVFEAMDGDPPDAILVVADSLTVLNRKRIYDYAGAHHIPALYEYDFLVRDGGLMSYGPDVKESMDRAADLTARIFNGAKPGDLPFEEPTRYDLVVNLKIAKATGIDLPPDFVALADEVIE
jgi:putative tryptophan/tyrosine transport system substrate-binding protein